MRIIKRYRNRRLYDTRTSRTITQFDLARMIREDEDIQVIDSATGEDITVAVLGRVMVSETSTWSDVRETKNVLRHIIYLGGNKSMSILKNTVLASIGVVQVTKAKAEKIIDELIKKGELDKSKRKAAVMELVEKAEKTTADLRAKILVEADKAQKGVTKFAKDVNWARQQDVQKLNDRVEKLTKALEDLQKKLEGQQ